MKNKNILKLYIKNNWITIFLSLIISAISVISYLSIPIIIGKIIDNFDKGCNNNFIGKATISKVAKYTINPIFILKSNEKSSFLILHVIIEPNRKKRINNTNMLNTLTYIFACIFSP
mgnify:CR=1 FL=1